MSGDAESLLHLYENSHSGKPVVFRDTTWIPLKDDKSRSSATNVIFDTLNVAQKHHKLNTAFMLLPLTFKKGSYTTDTPTNIAPKDSNIHLCAGTRVGLANGDSILADSDGASIIANKLRMLLEFTPEGLKERGLEMCFVPDNFPNLGSDTITATNQNDINPLTTTYSTGTAGTGGSASSTVTGVNTAWTTDMIGSVIAFATGVGGVITAVANATSLTVGANITVATGTNYTIYLRPTVNPTYNAGLHQRIHLTKQNKQTGSDANTFTILFKIPLRFIHDWYRQMNFVIQNAQFYLEFPLAYPMDATFWYNCFLAASDAAGGGTSSAYPDSVEFTPGKASLYFETVTLETQDLKLFNDTLSGKGFIKPFPFLQPYFKKLEGGGTAPNNTLTVMSSVNRLVRVVAFAVYTANAARSWEIGFNPNVQFQTMIFKLGNENINPRRVYSGDIENFQTLKEQTHHAGESTSKSSLINYQQYKQKYQFWYVADLQRRNNRQSVEDNLELSIEYTRNDNNAIDFYVMYEREKECVFKFNGESASCIVSS